jgi:acyl-CoA synthetase (AMP-forming)/AMP-acid ligase II
VAYRDDEGYIYICDRRKDLVITGGANVYPAEVEAAVEGIPGVFECAVFGLPDDTWGERVHACVVVDDPATFTLDAFTAAARERLAGYKVPRTVELFDELPHMESGKIDKMALRNRYGVGVAVGAPAVSTGRRSGTPRGPRPTGSAFSCPAPRCAARSTCCSAPTWGWPGPP